MEQRAQDRCFPLDDLPPLYRRCVQECRVSLPIESVYGFYHKSRTWNESRIKATFDRIVTEDDAKTFYAIYWRFA